MIAFCKKICEEDYFTHESIPFGANLTIYNHPGLGFIVLRVTRMGFVDIICEVCSEYFREHFTLMMKRVDI